MRTRQKRVANDTWRSLGCRTTPLEHWSKRKPAVEPRWAKQQTKKKKKKKEKTKRIQAFFMRTAQTLIRLGRCLGWSGSSLGAQSFCWFCHESAHMCDSRDWEMIRTASWVVSERNGEVLTCYCLSFSYIKDREEFYFGYKVNQLCKSETAKAFKAWSTQSSKWANSWDYGTFFPL